MEGSGKAKKTKDTELTFAPLLRGIFFALFRINHIYIYINMIYNQTIGVSMDAND